MGEVYVKYHMFLDSELAFSPNDNTVHIHKKSGAKWEKGFVLTEVIRIALVQC